MQIQIRNLHNKYPNKDWIGLDWTGLNSSETEFLKFSCKVVYKGGAKTAIYIFVCTCVFVCV